MRTGRCEAVLTGDTIVVAGGGGQIRYANVWAPAPDTPLGEALKAYNERLVLGREIRYLPNGHMHWDSVGIIADVYVSDLWVNQELRFWLSRRMGAPAWRDGIPGADNPASERLGRPADG